MQAKASYQGNLNQARGVIVLLQSFKYLLLLYGASTVKKSKLSTIPKYVQCFLIILMWILLLFQSNEYSLQWPWKKFVILLFNLYLCCHLMLGHSLHFCQKQYVKHPPFFQVAILGHVNDKKHFERQPNFLVIGIQKVPSISMRGARTRIYLVSNLIFSASYYLSLSQTLCTTFRYNITAYCCGWAHFILLDHIEKVP